MDPSFLYVASVSHAGAMRAVRRYDEFGDGVVGEAAAEAGCDVICTRNTGDFGPARSEVLTPTELVLLLRYASPLLCWRPPPHPANRQAVQYTQAMRTNWRGTRATSAHSGSRGKASGWRTM